MKMMLVSIGIMFTILLSCVLNNFKAQKNADILVSELDSITGVEDAVGIDLFVKAWNEHRPFFVCTVTKSKIEIVDNAVFALSASGISQNISEFVKNMIIAKNSIKELALYSSFDIRNIL